MICDNCGIETKELYNFLCLSCVLVQNKELKEKYEELKNYTTIEYGNCIEIITKKHELNEKLQEENKKLKQALVDSTIELYQGNCGCRGDKECNFCRQIKENKKLLED